MTEITPGASITIFPIDAYHPSIVEDEEYEDDEFDLPDFANTLKYYWDVVSEGVQNFKGWLMFNNQKEDYQAPNKGDGHGYDHYVAARLLKDHVEWDKDDILSDSYDKGEIVFKNFDFDNDANISGQYTAGLVDANGIGSIPGQLKVYVTKHNGDWKSKGTWAVAQIQGNHIYFDGNGDAVIDEAATAELPDTFECPERGSIVFVYHNVDVTHNGINVFHTTVGRNSDDEIGKVSLYDTKSHRFGVVAGRGRIVTKSGSLPRGFYNKFVEAKGGTIEYAGDEDYEINMSVFNNVEFSGSHKRILGPNDLVVNGFFKANGDESQQNKLSIINTNGATWNIHGDFVYNRGTFVAPTEGTVSIIKMCGGDGQEMYSEDGFDPDVLHINILEVANSSLNGVHAKLNINIVEHVKFEDGVLYTYDNKRFAIINFSEDESLTVQNYNKDRFINGPLTKLILNEGKWTFPVGSHISDEEKQNNRLGHFTVYDFSPGDNSGSGYVTVKYFYEPHLLSGETDRYGAGIIAVDRSEYWTVKPDAAGSTFGLRLRWDETSLISSDAASVSNVCITNFDGENWLKVNSKAVSTSTQTGTVYTDDPAVLTHDSQSYVYTLAHTGSITFNWTGEFDNNWFDTRNWSGKQVPTFTDFVIIGTVEPGKKYPVINTSEIAEAKFLVLSDKSSLTILPGAKLTVFTDVVVNSGCSLVLKAPTASRDNDQSIDPAGSLIYRGTFSGNLTFQRFVRSWEYERMAVPVTGYTANVGSFKYGADLYGYDQKNDVGGDQYTFSYDDDEEQDNPIILARGWYVYPGGYPKTDDLTVPYRYLCNPQLPSRVLSFTGAPFKDGSKSVVTSVDFFSNDKILSAVGASQDMLDGWNFVANPFVSAVDAEALKFHNVDATIYLHNSKTNTPIAYSINGGLQIGVITEHEYRYIPAGQSFFVHATAAAENFNGSVEFPKESRSHGNSKTVIKSGSKPSGVGKVVFKTSGGNYDYQSLVYFADDATEAFDSKYDAYMVSASSSKLLSFYTYGSDPRVALAANGLPHSVKDGGEITIGYTANTAGTYKLTIPVLTVDDADVYLVDAQEGTTTKLTEGYTTNVTVEAGANKKRFKLVFRAKTEEPAVQEPEEVVPLQPEEVVIVNPIPQDPQEPEVINPVVINPVVPEVNEPGDTDPEVAPIPEPYENGEWMRPYPADQEEAAVERDIRVNVYPVPSYGVVKVSLGSLVQETGSVKIIVASITGRVVINKNVSEDLVEIDLTGRPGVYIVRMMTPTSTVVKRIVIE